MVNHGDRVHLEGPREPLLPWDWIGRACDALRQDEIVDLRPQLTRQAAQQVVSLQRKQFSMSRSRQKHHNNCVEGE